MINSKEFKVPRLFRSLRKSTKSIDRTGNNLADDTLFGVEG
jgi:hypothetical protein